MSVGGSNQQCFILANGLWTFHSKLKKDRLRGTVIKMPNAVYVFGGEKNPFTSEILWNGTSKWEEGPRLNMFFEQATFSREKRIYFGNGHKISDTELILLKDDMIVKFDVNDIIFSKFMSFENDFVSCASVLRNQTLIITGGVSVYGNFTSNQTLIVDLDSKTFRKVGTLNIPRFSHGMAFTCFENETKLTVFGGQDEENIMNSMETFDFETETWELSEVKLELGRHSFGYIYIGLLLNFDQELKFFSQVTATHSNV